MTSILKVDNLQDASGTGSPYIKDHVLQVKTATDSTERTTTSTSFETRGNTLAVSITPKSTLSKILVTCSLSYGTPSGTVSLFLTLFRDSTNLGDVTKGFGNLFDGSNYHYGHTSLQILDAPSTTSTIIYQPYFRIGSGSNDGRINNTGAFSTITAMEIGG